MEEPTKLDRLVPLRVERRVAHGAPPLLTPGAHHHVRVRLAVRVGRHQIDCPRQVHLEHALPVESLGRVEALHAVT